MPNDLYDQHIDEMKSRDRKLRGFCWVERARYTEPPAISDADRLAAYKRKREGLNPIESQGGKP